MPKLKRNDANQTVLVNAHAFTAIANEFTNSGLGLIPFSNVEPTQRDHILMVMRSITPKTLSVCIENVVNNGLNMGWSAADLTHQWNVAHDTLNSNHAKPERTRRRQISSVDIEPPVGEDGSRKAALIAQDDAPKDEDDPFLDDAGTGGDNGQKGDTEDGEANDDVKEAPANEAGVDAVDKILAMKLSRP
ncbi:MAG: hypothetical protein ACRDBH_08835 [Bosea sp. (in: a-proteobacteria)]